VKPLLESIRLLHNPHRRVYGWYVVRDGDSEIAGSFHIAESDDLAVLAQMENDQVILEPVAWEEMYATALEFPPNSEPIPGGEYVVPVERPVAEGKSGGVWLETLHGDQRRTPAQRDHDLVRELTDPSTLLFAMQVLTARKDPRGTEIVAEFPLNYYVGGHGALMTVHKRPDADSAPQVHVIPATRSTFLDQIQSL
jgi:hypothetical protein